LRATTFHYNLVNDSWSVDRLPELDSTQTLVLAFGATEIQTVPHVLQTIRSSYPNSHILGCSTAGEVIHGRLVDGTLAIAVISFEETQLLSGAVVVRDPKQSEDAGRNLGQQMLALDQPKAVLILAEGLRIDHRGFLRGMQAQLGAVPIVGALAADSQRYEASWVWCGDRLQSGLVGAVGLYGDGISVHSAVSELWGEEDQAEQVITRATGSRVFSIGGRPATDVCTGPSGLLPLRILGDDGAQGFASPLASNPDKSVVFNREVAGGSRVQTVMADSRYLIKGADEVARVVERVAAAAISQSGTNAVAFASSSAGRRSFLGDQAEREMHGLVSSLPESIPLIGLYSYGEVSPNENNRAQLHDAGFGVTLIVESVTHTAVTRPARGSPPSTPPDPPPAGRKPKFVDAHTSSSLVQARPIHVEMGASSADCYDLGALQFISIKGTINETFNSAAIAERMHGRVVLDLGTVELVTSFGVRNWLELIASAENRGVDIYLAHCSEAIVNQMLMIRNFGGSGQVVSFGAPYICTACSDTFEYLLDCENSAEEIGSAQPPDVACPSCGNRAIFDEDPEQYFEFVRGDIGKALPFDVRNALAERRLEWMTQVDDAIEKRVEGERTVFRINREVDERIRWKRVLSGVEGVVRLDFARSKGASDLGAERFLTAVRMQTEAVSRIVLDQVPVEIVQHLIATEQIPKLQVRTLSLPARCSNCGVVRQALVDPVGVREAHRQGLTPESECRRCSGSVPIELPSDIVHYFLGVGGEPGASLMRSDGEFSPLTWVVVGAIVALIAIIIVLVAS
jgi:hypothetical protein